MDSDQVMDTVIGAPVITDGDRKSPRVIAPFGLIGTRIEWHDLALPSGEHDGFRLPPGLPVGIFPSNPGFVVLRAKTTMLLPSIDRTAVYPAVNPAAGLTYRFSTRVRTIGP